jgi:hypothetical protein
MGVSSHPFFMRAGNNSEKLLPVDYILSNTNTDVIVATIEPQITPTKTPSENTEILVNHNLKKDHILFTLSSRVAHKII